MFKHCRNYDRAETMLHLDIFAFNVILTDTIQYVHLYTANHTSNTLMELIKNRYFESIFRRKEILI